MELYCVRPNRIVSVTIVSCCFFFFFFFLTFAAGLLLLLLLCWLFVSYTHLYIPSLMRVNCLCSIYWKTLLKFLPSFFFHESFCVWPLKKMNQNRKKPTTTTACIHAYTDARHQKEINDQAVFNEHRVQKSNSVCKNAKTKKDEEEEQRRRRRRRAPSD